MPMQFPLDDLSALTVGAHHISGVLYCNDKLLRGHKVWEHLAVLYLGVTMGPCMRSWTHHGQLSKEHEYRNNKSTQNEAIYRGHSEVSS